MPGTSIAFPTRRMARLGLLTCVVLLVAACGNSRRAAYSVPETATQPAQSDKVWARADGRRMAGNRALTEQGQRDLAECRAMAAIEGQPGKYHLPTLNDCMGQRGYVEIERPS